jgi:two-component system response regulator AtoC
VAIKLPPLRNHPEDIPLLCQSFIDRFNQKLDLSVKGITAEAMANLVEQSWPGNVRELENIIERAMVLSSEELLGLEDLTSHFGHLDVSAGGLDELTGFSLKNAKKVWEKKLISRALEATGGNRSRAAVMLELSFPSLLNKIKAYNIKVEK